MHILSLLMLHELTKSLPDIRTHGIYTCTYSHVHICTHTRVHKLNIIVTERSAECEASNHAVCMRIAISGGSG